jgi:hypothetical protein
MSTELSNSILLTRASAVQSRSTLRIRTLQWLRTAHVWVGLWGAMLGFVFGLTGFLMNHRAVMKIPVEHAEVAHARIPLTQSFATAEALAEWLKSRAAMPNAQVNIRQEPAAAIRWRDDIVQQPERWNIHLNTPKLAVNAKYTPGSGVIDVETQDATAWGILMRMHKSTGASRAWILAADTVAGALMFLTLTGVLLWSKFRAPRLLGVAILIVLPTTALLCVASA